MPPGFRAGGLLPFMRPQFIFDKESHTYTLDGEEYPSVTTIIEATVPKNLAWWGMIVGIEGLCKLEDEYGRYDDWTRYSTDDIVKGLQYYGLTVNQVMKSAGLRGNAVHKALEQWGRNQEVPHLEDYPEATRPYIVGLANFLVKNEPEILESEVRTGSVGYKYAGTFDLKARFSKGKHKGRVALLDCKTTKRVYPDQHFPQLEAYEHAEIESGEAPTDIRGIIHLAADGNSGLAVSCDTFSDFAILLDHYRSGEARKQKLRDSGMRQDGMEKVRKGKHNLDGELHTEVL